MHARHARTLCCTAVTCGLLWLAIGAGAAAAGPSTAAWATQTPPAPLSAGSTLSTAAPTSPVRLIFVHHSTGQAWLEDGYGNLGKKLRDSRYYVSDTNYGWGPDAIGDQTDVGHWWTWFRGPKAATYTTALYTEAEQHSSYSRLATRPASENAVVMFKSCFPNSNVGGSPSDPIPAVADNPLKGGSGPLTVGNAKGIYLDLLNYFKTRRDKLLVLVVSPPLRAADTSPGNAANARYLANWLVSPTGLLKDYTAGNVFVFDYYTVLTGGHHRVVGHSIEHTVGPSNYLAFPTGDSHPAAAGDVIATTEFVPMLNAAYREWTSGTRVVQRAVTLSTPVLSSPSRIKHGVRRTWKGTLSPAQLVTGAVRVQIQRRRDGAWHSYKTVWVTAYKGAAGWRVKFAIKRAGRFRLRATHSDADHRYGVSAWHRVRVY